jgi:hypothetical protein
VDIESENVTINGLIESGISTKWENLFLKGDTYKNFATLIVIATRGKSKASCKCECGKTVEMEYTSGFHPWVVESWKRFIKPMNVPIIEMVISGHEVGVAYEKAIEQLLGNDGLKHIKYVLFLEDDIIVPFMPNSFGPLIELYKHMEEYDVAGGLYWTKGEPSLPLIYGNGDFDSPIPFEVNINWKANDVVAVNGIGMGFTLMKRSIFEDTRIEKPYFKTVGEVTSGGIKVMTQDLYFCEKIKKLGYKICVDTSIRCGHLDLRSEKVY